MAGEKRKLREQLDSYMKCLVTNQCILCLMEERKKRNLSPSFNTATSNSACQAKLRCEHPDYPRPLSNPSNNCLFWIRTSNMKGWPPFSIRVVFTLWRNSPYRWMTTFAPESTRPPYTDRILSCMKSSSVAISALGLSSNSEKELCGIPVLPFNSSWKVLSSL